MKHMAQSTASGLRKCVRDKTKMTISGWNKTTEMALLAAEGTGERGAPPHRQLQIVR